MNLVNRRRGLLLLNTNPRFYIVYNSVARSYEYEQEQTWADFVNSEYNDGTFTISSEGGILYNGDATVKYDATAVATSDKITPRASYNAVVKIYIYKSGNSALSNNFSVKTGDNYKVSTSYINVSSYWEESGYTAGRIIIGIGGEMINFAEQFPTYSTLNVRGKYSQEVNFTGNDCLMFGITTKTFPHWSNGGTDFTAYASILETSTVTKSVDITGLNGYIGASAGMANANGENSGLIYDMWIE